MIEIVITSSVIILAILLLRKVTRGRISMRFRYALWLAVVLRLILPAPMADSALSVMNLLPEGSMLAGEDRLTFWDEKDAISEWADDTDAAVQMEVGTETDGNAVVGNVITGATWGESGDRERKYGETEGLSGEEFGQKQKAEAIKTVADRKILQRAVWMIWLAGVMAVGAYMAVGQIRFVRILHRRRSIVSEEKLPKQLAGGILKRRLKVYQIEGLSSPCLVGHDIYVDKELIAKKQKFLHVLAHEYCHAVQFDTLWALVRSVLAAVYWFHPLVWVAAFAARQDSELACDEAVIELLGEEERFAYGRTLLYLLAGGRGKIDCAGTALTMEGRKRGVKERVHMIAQSADRTRGMAALAVVTMFLVCGCAFTGSEQGKDAVQNGREQSVRTEQDAETEEGHTERQQTIGTPSDEEFARIRKEYEDAIGDLETQEQTQGDGDFLLALNYQGVMTGKDDSELFLDRQIDYQAYYEYLYGAQDGQGEERKNPLTNGWYLICRNEEAQISLYGLYTEEFGFRGMKTLIGEDVNTYDIDWCPSGMNGNGANIRVLEGAQDGFPRRFVFKILAEETDEREIWKLYSGFRYDTGTVELEELTDKIYREWADRNLSFTVSESQDKVLITYEGDMELEPLAISDYQDQKVEAVLISPDVVGFELDSDNYAEAADERQDGYEGVVLCLAVGLKLEGMDGVWFDGLSPLNVQVLCHQEEESGFVLRQPKINTSMSLHSLRQSRKLEEIRGKDQLGGE